MARRPHAETMSGEVRDLLRTDILGAHWSPGDKLQVARLAQHYETSTTVVREALTRLAGERLVQFRPNRGFFVTELTADELRDVNELRCRVEEFAVTRAVERGDLTWESELMAAHHRLERTPRRAADDPEHMSDAWVVAHRAFHLKLLEPCGLDVLTDLATTLGDMTLLYRQLAVSTPGAAARDVPAEHAAILEAALDRDAPRAARLLREHYTRTVEIVVATDVFESAAPDAEPAG